MSEPASKWVALLKGINVGGHNKVPMTELRALCSDLGWREVQTYIASGNLVFAAAGDAAALAESLRRTLADHMGINVPILVVSASAIRMALEDCPFEVEKGNQCHAFFLWSDPVVDWQGYQALRLPSEHLAVSGRVAWLHAPEGFGRSKLAEKLHKVITGTEMTGRNLNTLRKLTKMSD